MDEGILPIFPPEPKQLVQHRTTLTLATAGQRFIDFTAKIDVWLSDVDAYEGLLTVFVQHTSASLTIQENADPSVQSDLRDALDRLAPKSSKYAHASEGPDDMPAHIKAMLTSISLSIPVVDGETALGTWQGVYLIEHRTAPHQRDVILHFVGSCKST